jgi:predicted PurR-regulated permease PerM
LLHILESVNGPPPADLRREGPAATGEQLRPYALAGITAVLLGLCGALALPFLSAIAWAVAFAIIAWPLHSWLGRFTTYRWLPAAASTFVVVVAIIVPGCFVAYQIVREADHATEAVGSPDEKKVRETLAVTPGMTPFVEWMDRRGVDIDREMHARIAAQANEATGLVQGTVNGIIQFVICLFILYHMLRDRGLLMENMRRIMPMTRDEANQVFKGAADSVHANLHATLITSVIDAVGGGLMFWACGIPSPLLWGVVMFVLSTLPIVGTFIVWMPAAGFLAATGHWPSAVALIAWGVVSWVVTDNFIYVRIAGNRMRLHQVPSLIAFLGGLSLFGAAGMILGPAILAVTVAVLEVWHRRSQGAKTPLLEVSPRPGWNLSSHPD